MKEEDESIQTSQKSKNFYLAKKKQHEQNLKMKDSLGGEGHRPTRWWDCQVEYPCAERFGQIDEHCGGRAFRPYNCLPGAFPQNHLPLSLCLRLCF